MRSFDEGGREKKRGVAARRREGKGRKFEMQVEIEAKTEVGF